MKSMGSGWENLKIQLALKGLCNLVSKILHTMALKLLYSQMRFHDFDRLLQSRLKNIKNNLRNFKNETSGKMKTFFNHSKPSAVRYFTQTNVLWFLTSWTFWRENLMKLEYNFCSWVQGVPMISLRSCYCLAEPYGPPEGNDKNKSESILKILHICLSSIPCTYYW